MWDLLLYYPYNTSFHSIHNDYFIKFKIINNDNFILEIYYVIENQIIKSSLIQIVLPHQERIILFPNKSNIAIIPVNKKEDTNFIKVKNDWTYIYP
jgi:hypothetical protein